MNLAAREEHHLISVNCRLFWPEIIWCPWNLRKSRCFSGFYQGPTFAPTPTGDNFQGTGWKLGSHWMQTKGLRFGGPQIIHTGTDSRKVIPISSAYVVIALVVCASSKGGLLMSHVNFSKNENLYRSIHHHPNWPASRKDGSVQRAQLRMPTHEHCFIGVRFIQIHSMSIFPTVQRAEVGSVEWLDLPLGSDWNLPVPCVKLRVFKGFLCRN